MGEREGRLRPKYLRMGEAARVGEGAPENDNAPAFTFTRGELGAFITDAVVRALETREPGKPVLLDREALSIALGCSGGMVDKLRRKGMPHLRLGDSPRFELERCLEWIRKDGAA